MSPPDKRSLQERLSHYQDALTPKGRILAEYVTRNPREAVFLRTRGLAEACGVSEATVVRFVDRLGYRGYGEFIQALRDLLDTELTLLDRVEITDLNGSEGERLGRVVMEEIRNLKQLFEDLDVEAVHRAVDLIRDAPAVYVVGARLSYTFAYYLGWSLTKIRPGVHIMNGSDSTCIDWLTVGRPKGLAVMIATSRYPNELIRLAKVIRRAGHDLILISDNDACPLAPFARLSLVAPCRHFPIVGSPSTITCLINGLIVELIGRDGDEMRRHQERLEQSYLENDVLFNLDRSE